MKTETCMANYVFHVPMSSWFLRWDNILILSNQKPRVVKDNFS